MPEVFIYGNHGDTVVGEDEFERTDSSSNIVRSFSNDYGSVVDSVASAISDFFE